MPDINKFFACLDFDLVSIFYTDTFWRQFQRSLNKDRRSRVWNNCTKWNEPSFRVLLVQRESMHVRFSDAVLKLIAIIKFLMRVYYFFRRPVHSPTCRKIPNKNPWNEKVEREREKEREREREGEREGQGEKRELVSNGVIS